MWHIHQAQRTQGDIKSPIGEQEFLGIHTRPCDLTQTLVGSHVLGIRHHLTRDIDTNDCSMLANLPGDAARDEASAARYVEHAFAWPYVSHLEQTGLGRR